MMTPLVWATLFRDAADVKRYHTRRVLRTQTVGAHSFNMLLLIDQVCPDARKEVFLAVMHHDLPEFFTGDMPAPIKRMNQRLSFELEAIEEQLAPLYRDFRLTPDEVKLVKWCDTMELVLWCLEEVELGNRGDAVCECIDNGLQWLSGMDIKINVVQVTMMSEARSRAIEYGCIPNV